MELIKRFSGHRRDGVFMGRARTRDEMFTYDRASLTMDRGEVVSAGKKLGGNYPVYDPTGRGRTCDSTGNFLVGELERLDPTMHDPLVAVSWDRDIDLREDVTIADEVSSYTLSTFASVGSLGAGNSIGNGKAWIGKETTQIAGVDLDISKIPHPLRPWALELKYTILELESAAKAGRPIDQQKYAALKLKHQMDIDEMVYIGDTSTGDNGLLTNSVANGGNITPVNFPAGASGSTAWATKSPDEILADFNLALTTTWANSGWAVVPDSILIPPAQYGALATAKVSLAGNKSILQYVQDNNLLATAGRGAVLRIDPLKWGIGAGAGGTIGVVAPGTDRMIVYTKDKNYVRYPMTLLQRTPIQYDGIFHKSTYFCRLGVLENVYPETVSYFDGL